MSIEILPDAADLRHERQARIIAEMTAADVDALVIGREGNARYVSGVPRLWLAGTRPFGPGCVLVRHTGALHLLTPWDEGVPADIPREHLFGYTFNGANQLKALQIIEGAAGFRRVATDALGPGAADMLRAAFPAADIVDGEALLDRARRVKSDTEIDAIAASLGIAERCLQHTAHAVRSGATARELTGVFMQAMGTEAVCMPSTQDAAWISSRTAAWRHAPRDAQAVDGDLVVLEAGVMLDGYTGDLARTVVVGSPTPAAAALLERCEALWQHLFAACVPDAPTSALVQVYADHGVEPPPTAIAHGLGLGFDAPIVIPALTRSTARDRLTPGMVFALTAHVWEAGVGSAVRTRAVHITADGAVIVEPAARRS